MRGWPAAVRGGRGPAGARPPGLLQPGVADLPLRRRRRRAARPAPDGAFALAAVRAASPPLVIDLVAPLAQGWPAGTRVSVVEARTYALRADAATGLLQIVAQPRAPGRRCRSSTSSQRFEVEWLVAGAAPAVRARPGRHAEHTTFGPLPPAAGVVGDPAWPAGENCVFARDAAGASVSRLAPLGSRCRRRAARRASSTGRGARRPPRRRAGTPTWRASSGVRVRVELAVASARLRPPFGAVSGPRRGPAPPGAAARAQRRVALGPDVGGAVTGARAGRRAARDSA